LKVYTLNVKVEKQTILNLNQMKKKKKGPSCWKGYRAAGKKKSPSGKKTKGGRTKMVNNCVKIGRKKR